MIKSFFKYIIFCGFLTGFLFVNAQDKTTIEAVSFNSSEREYAPVYFNNGLVFCSTNIKNEALTYLVKETGKQHTDMYFVKKDSNGFGEPSLFSRALKSSFHDGPITFSADGKTAYFTRIQTINKKLSNNIGAENNLGVFKATFNGSEWTDIQPCFFNSNDYNVGQPSLSTDGNKMFVVSDKDGGFGGKDIYYSELKNGQWSDLFNLGEDVNSSSNEMFPFINKKGKLFYSSDKEGGNGGLDVYSAYQDNERWIELNLQDTSINSAFDDFGIVWNQEQTEGYFSSNRNGSDDIFKITVIYPEFTDCEELKEEQLCFEFFEEATLNADSVAMVYEWDFGDGSKEQQLEVYHCYKDPGLYIVELNVMDSMIDKTFINEATYELEILPIIQPRVVCPDSVFINEEFTIDVQQGKWEAYTIESSYINFGDEQVVKARQEKHRYKTPGEKIVEVLIAGTNLETGKLELNCFYKTIKVVKKDTTKEKKVLSLLEQQGFTIKEQLEEDTEGFFYALEILTSPTSVISDSTILKNYINQVKERYNSIDETYSYFVGKEDSPYDLIGEFKMAHQQGFETAEVKQYSTNQNEELATIGLINIDEEGNTNVVLKGILFNYESFSLTKESKKELDNLVLFLQNNKSINIEIEAHTDNKGNEAYNQKLSQKRANSVVNYLVQKGISNTRLKAKGYGETKPIASNTTDEGRAKNRRVAFKILAK